MSYTPEFAPDARSQWRALDPILQELALDVIEVIAAAPPRRNTGHDIGVLEADGVRHSILVRVSVDHARKIVTVIGIGHRPRPLSH